MAHPLKDHLEKLHYFVAVSEAGSLAKAAEKISLSQPSLSRAIKILEEALGVTLLVRGSKGIELTAAGRRLYETSRALLDRVTQMEAEVCRDDTGLLHLEIGTKEPYAVHLWPTYLKVLREQFPDLGLSLNVRRANSELLQKLAEGTLRLIMIPNPRPSENIVAYELFQDPMALFVADGAGAAPGSRIFAFGEGMCGAGMSVLEAFEANGGDKNRLVIVGSHDVAKAMAEGGLGPALLPTWMGSIGPRPLRQVPDPDLDPKWFGTMKVCLCVHERDARHPRMKKVVTSLREIYRKKKR